MIARSGICFASAVLTGLLAVAAPGVAAQDATAVETLFPASPPSPPEQAPRGTKASSALDWEKEATLFEKRLDAIEARLGTSPRPPSVAYNLERRLADLEARLQKMEQQMARMQQWEQRIRRLEMQRP